MKREVHIWDGKIIRGLFLDGTSLSVAGVIVYPLARTVAPVVGTYVFGFARKLLLKGFGTTGYLGSYSQPHDHVQAPRLQQHPA
jgi:hypothetical protein